VLFFATNSLQHSGGKEIKMLLLASLLLNWLSI